MQNNKLNINFTSCPVKENQSRIRIISNVLFFMLNHSHIETMESSCTCVLISICNRKALVKDIISISVQR